MQRIIMCGYFQQIYTYIFMLFIYFGRGLVDAAGMILQWSRKSLLCFILLKYDQC